MSTCPWTMRPRRSLPRGNRDAELSTIEMLDFQRQSRRCTSLSKPPRKRLMQPPVSQPEPADFHSAPNVSLHGWNYYGISNRRLLALLMYQATRRERAIQAHCVLREQKWNGSKLKKAMHSTTRNNPKQWPRDWCQWRPGLAPSVAQQAPNPRLGEICQRSPGGVPHSVTVCGPARDRCCSTTAAKRSSMHTALVEKTGSSDKQSQITD